MQTTEFSKRHTAANTNTPATVTPAYDYVPTLDLSKQVMQITVGDQTITAIQCIEWTQEYSNDLRGFFHTYGSGIFDIFHDNHEKTVADIPVLRKTASNIDVDYSLHHDLIQITAYRYVNGELVNSNIDLGHGISNILTLEKGEWYVALSYESNGTYIEPLSAYELYRYSYVFKWVVE